VDRIFEFLREDPRLTVLEPQALQQLKAAVRAEFRGEECYIASRPASARQELVSQVLSMFNGRNATEVARALSIGRATVYRVLKQSSRRSVAPPA
jgi:DNA invertase Pin-like site-specific DNA recombinase